MKKKAVRPNNPALLIALQVPILLLSLTEAAGPESEFVKYDAKSVPSFETLTPVQAQQRRQALARSAAYFGEPAADKGYGSMAEIGAADKKGLSFPKELPCMDKSPPEPETLALMKNFEKMPAKGAPATAQGSGSGSASGNASSGSASSALPYIAPSSSQGVQSETVVGSASASESPLAGGALWSAPFYSSTSAEGAPGRSNPVGTAHALDIQESKLNTTLNEAVDVSGGQELLSKAIQTQSALTRQRESDTKALTNSYENLSLPEIAANMHRAVENLDASRSIMKDARALEEGLKDRSELGRFTLANRKASDLAQTVAGIADEALQRSAKPREKESPFRTLMSLGSADAQALGDAAEEIGTLLGLSAKGDGEEAAAPTAQDLQTALAQRTAMYEGLSPQEQKDIASKLGLIEHPRFRTPAGSEVSVTLLHNGYYLGGSDHGVDCSSLISNSLPAELRKGRLTTLDFAIIWGYLTHGKTLPKPPIITEPLSVARATLIKRSAESFLPLYLGRGELPMPGDLLVFRVPWEPSGHVFAVKSYNPKNHLARVVEAAQSTGIVQERDFQLTVAPTSRVLRPGIFGLRLVKKNNPGCTYTAKAGATP